MNRSLRTTAIAFACSIAASVANAQIVLYENDNFDGRSYRATYSVSNLNDGGFNDKASSVTVRGGRWQLCDDAYFRGSCVTLGPGEYSSLRAMGMNDKVSSVRELGWTPDGGGGWSGSNSYNRDSGYDNRYTSSGNNYRGGNWGSGSRAVLFSGYNLSGEAFVVNASGVGDLDRAGFNDKARSLRVESGYWLFCTDANFQGDCHTYGPGDYPSLPGGQSHSISSGRRISANYPYRSNPNWNAY
jgi:Beta/Gamma crystallin